MGNSKVQTKAKLINNTARGRVIATLHTLGFNENEEDMDRIETFSIKNYIINIFFIIFMNNYEI